LPKRYGSDFDSDSPAIVLATEIRQAVFDYRRSRHPLIQLDYKLVLVVARDANLRLQFCEQLERGNDDEIRRILDAVLFDASQTIRLKLSTPRRNLRGAVEFLKVGGGSVFAGGLVALASTLTNPVAPFTIALLGAIAYGLGQREQSLVLKVLERIEADTVAIDELRRMLQTGTLRR
jgi:hypothetical protein